MQFASSLAPVSKIDRAALLALAFADLCVRGGERAGLLGLTRPLATQGVVERFAEAIATDERLRGPSLAALPPALPAAPRSMVLMIGDFLSEAEDVGRAIRAVSAEGAIGELVMIVDPIEETYPFSGNTEFLHPAGSLSVLTPRAQNLRDAYLARLAAHRETIRGICARSGWGMSIHRTDRSPAEMLLALRIRRPDCFDAAGPRGAYRPLDAGDDVVCFTRGEGVLVAVAVRRRVGDGTLPALGGAWHDVLSGEPVSLDAPVPAASLLRAHGVSVLERT